MILSVHFFCFLLSICPVSFQDMFSSFTFCVSIRFCHFHPLKIVFHLLSMFSLFSDFGHPVTEDSHILKVPPRCRALRDPVPRFGIHLPSSPAQGQPTPKASNSSGTSNTQKRGVSPSPFILHLYNPQDSHFRCGTQLRRSPVSSQRPNIISRRSLPHYHPPICFLCQVRRFSTLSSILSAQEHHRRSRMTWTCFISLTGIPYGPETPTPTLLQPHGQAHMVFSW